LEEKGRFTKEMTSLKDELKEKINWNQVDLLMVGYLFLQVSDQQRIVLMKMFTGHKTRRQSTGQRNWQSLEVSKNQEQQHLHLYGWTQGHHQS
jgi:hypothetical protein